MFLYLAFILYTRLIFCCLSSHMGIIGTTADCAAKPALRIDVSECVISYTDAYHFICQYVQDL